MTEENIKEMFKSRSYRATPQRIAIYKYLSEHPTHPDVEEVYQFMLRDNPSTSRTTIYNVLESLEKEGLILAVKIDSERIHYDADIRLHGHFKCQKCNRIFDFLIEDIKCTGIDGFETKTKDVYFGGLCPECKKSN